MRIALWCLTSLVAAYVLLIWLRARDRRKPDTAFRQVFAEKGGRKEAKFGPYDQAQAERTWRQRQSQSPSGRPYAGPEKRTGKVLDMPRKIGR